MSTFEALNLTSAFSSLGSLFYSPVTPANLPNPRLLHFNRKAADLIDLTPDQALRKDAAAYLCGNQLPAGAQPIAAIYAGHQFGYFVPQLGDGRAILLGGIESEHGYWELQL